jgi:uncharacterized protein YdaU (DUF1376 family)
MKTTNNKWPYLPWYPRDWLSSLAVRMMDAEQRGWYFQLLMEGWETNPQNRLPNDDAKLQSLVGANPLTCQNFEARWKVVREQFKPRGKYVFNPRMERELEKLSCKSRQASHAGKASATARRHRTDVERMLNRRSDSVERVFNQPQPDPDSEPKPKIPPHSPPSLPATTAGNGDCPRGGGIPSLEEVEAVAKQIVGAIPLAKIWFDSSKASGWKINGEPMRDWPAVFCGFARVALTSPSAIAERNRKEIEAQICDCDAEILKCREDKYRPDPTDLTLWRIRPESLEKINQLQAKKEELGRKL